MTLTKLVDSVKLILESDEKAKEEAKEFFENPCVEELADVQEVIDALADIHRWDVTGARFKKIDQRGAFWRRYVLEEVEE